jgi:hypothetical protein
MRKPILRGLCACKITLTVNAQADSDYERPRHRKHVSAGIPFFASDLAWTTRAVCSLWILCNMGGASSKAIRKRRSQAHDDPLDLVPDDVLEVCSGRLPVRFISGLTFRLAYMPKVENEVWYC